MDNKRHTGAGSAAVKYDILTALTVAGLNGSAKEHLSMSRLTAVITARYNWRLDELTMGQREMSTLWGVGDRTVKREVKAWLDNGFLICTRPGVRGRVASYRLNMARLLSLTQPVWPLIGPDFEARMDALLPGRETVVRLDAHRTAPDRCDTAGGWETVAAQLSARFPSQFNAWIAPLRAVDDGETLTLDAKSAFAAEYVKTHFGRDIAEAARVAWDTPRRVVIRGPASLATRQ